MPNTIQAFPQNNTITNNPNASMGVNPATYIGSGGRPVLTLAQITAAITSFLTMLQQATGINLGTIFAGLDLTQPGAVLAAIEGGVAGLAGGVQAIIDAIVAGLTGSASTGNDPAAVVAAFINQGLAIPTEIFDQLWAAIAQLSAGQQAQQNAPGTVLTDDFATVGVSGYTNITGTLAISAAGPYVQTTNRALGYRTTGPSTNQHGAQIVIDANQQGSCAIGICADTAATSYALLEVYSGFAGDAVRLATGSSPTVAVIQRQTDFIATRLANTNTFDIWYEAATNTFHLLRNAQKVFDWPDVTNIVTHDASHRNVLLLSNGDDNTTNGSRGPGIRKLTAYDRT